MSKAYGVHLVGGSKEGGAGIGQPVAGPTVAEVEQYAKEKGHKVNARAVIGYFGPLGWWDEYGYDWRDCTHMWADRPLEYQELTPLQHIEFMERALEIARGELTGLADALDLVREAKGISTEPQAALVTVSQDLGELRELFERAKNGVEPLDLNKKRFPWFYPHKSGE